MLRRVIEILFGLFFGAEVLFLGASFVLVYWLTEWPADWPFPYSSGLFAILVGRVVFLVLLGSLVVFLFFRGSSALRWALPVYLMWAVLVLCLWSVQPDNPKFIEFRDDLAAQYMEGRLDQEHWHVADSTFAYPILLSYVLWGASLLYVFIFRPKAKATGS